MKCCAADRANWPELMFASDRLADGCSFRNLTKSISSRASAWPWKRMGR